MGQILDVRNMVPKDRHPRIFDTYKELNPGESFVLINDHEPKPLLYQFQNEHDGEFEWWPLEQGPQAWRVRIEKRTEIVRDRSLTDYFQTDHKRLDGIFAKFEDSAESGSWGEAAIEFREFRLGLKRHIKAEEEILFPLFEEKTGMHDNGPTFVMKMEHKEIHEWLDKILSGTEAENSAQVSEGKTALMNILADHNMKEEHILYPESDSFATDAERAQVIKKAQLL
ncbi:MAG: DUF2249 domain-containing protein [Deltaproteobacteria bacterium]|nr:DUF2249 domain-containing protein [Deltaproteobacteria bacterium]